MRWETMWKSAAAASHHQPAGPATRSRIRRTDVPGSNPTRATASPIPIAK